MFPSVGGNRGWEWFANILMLYAGASNILLGPETDALPEMATVVPLLPWETVWRLALSKASDVVSSLDIFVETGEDMSEIVDPVIAVPAVAGPVGVDPAAAGKVEAIVELFTAVSPAPSHFSVLVHSCEPRGCGETRKENQKPTLPGASWHHLLQFLDFEWIRLGHSLPPLARSQNKKALLARRLISPRIFPKEKEREKRACTKHLVYCYL